MTPIRNAYEDAGYAAAYAETHALAGLELERDYRPLARGDEPCEWVNETRIAPWVVYVLKPEGRAACAGG